MKTGKRSCFAILAIMAGAFVLARAPAQGPEKGEQAKPYLPKAAYDELVDRGVKRLRETLKGRPEPGQLARAQREAAFLVAYTLGAAPEVPAAERQALRYVAAELARQAGAGNVGRANELAARLSPLKPDPKARPGPVPWGQLLELSDLEAWYRQPKRGGQGIPPALEGLPGFKAPSVDHLLMKLARTAPPREPLQKGARELELLAYQTAAAAEIMPGFAPRKRGAVDRTFVQNAGLLRDAALELAAAARAWDPAAVQRAARTIEKACNNCHLVFRGGPVLLLRFGR